MKNQFVTYEIALKLKELGFDELCFGLYKNEIFYRDYDTFQWNEFLNCIKAPLWQQVIDWFREKYEIDIYPEPTYSLTEYNFKIITIQGKSKRQEYFKEMNKTYSFQEARKQAILKAIELCQK